jgi:hypothetical protein
VEVVRNLLGKMACVQSLAMVVLEAQQLVPIMVVVGGTGGVPVSGAYSAGGGGGGGGHIDGDESFDSIGFGGGGGDTGQERTVTYDLTNANSDGTLAVTINPAGNGGTANAVSNNSSNRRVQGGTGGAGRSGLVAVSGILDGYVASTLSDLSGKSEPWLDGSAPTNVNNATLNTGNNNNTVLATASANGDGVWFIASGQTIYQDGTFNINGSNSWMKTNGVSGRGNQYLYSAATSFSNTQVNFYSGGNTTTQFFVEGYIDAGGNFEGKRRIQIGAYGLSEWGT